MTKQEYLKKAAELDAQADAEVSVIASLIVCGVDIEKNEAFKNQLRRDASEYRMLANMNRRQRGAYLRGEM